MTYTIDAVLLWLQGLISFRSLRMVLWTRQPAVCGRGASYIICRETARGMTTQLEAEVQRLSKPVVPQS